MKTALKITCEFVEVQVERPATEVGKLLFKPADMESVYNLGGKIIDSTLREKVQSGNVIVINRATPLVRSQDNYNFLPEHGTTMPLVSKYDSERESGDTALIKPEVTEQRLTEAKQ